MNSDEDRFKGMNEAYAKLYGQGKIYTSNAMVLIHARALAAHCECLGMNAENSYAVCLNERPPHTELHYHQVLYKWGLVNEKGEPLI
jgi:hypothetical protein